ncbi:protein NRT1/ PTR FAMILY 2.3-like [Triticum dicoccoides]|uniref:protein NRT1/ PTR FAMILY 2.3-like n=1 Tax=Triticum dicoccoides TaxID=85692 RepID=UPI00188E85ED|nr:protein NRT1/ PTR FAMILY 2.3-like [Triticum dicoccoides]
MDSSPRPQYLEDQEAQTKAGGKRGGWITLPFIVATMLGLGLAVNGTTSNMLVYLLKEYHVDGVKAAQIANVVRGSLNLVPIAGAVLSDSYLGCFPVILAGAAINVLAFVLFTLTAALPSLRPPHCTLSSVECQQGSPGQLFVLYAAICLLAIGAGGTRFNIATMGADQFSSTRDKDSFFNWYLVFLYASFMLGDTAIVYIQDSVSWAVGFGVCLATTAFGTIMLLLGVCYYRMPATKASPYTELARVIVAAVRKGSIKVGGAQGSVQYNVGAGAVVDPSGDGAPSKSLRFLNRAAMITTSHKSSVSGDASAGAWRLCTVQQVEDLKAVVSVFPLWSSGILLFMSIGVMIGMIVLQALAMDRSVGPHFSIPAGSVGVSCRVSFILATLVLDRVIFPLWRKITGGTPPTPLQRVGIGHVLNVGALVAAALVERRRLAQPGVPMSVMWLLFPMGIAGVGEALHFPGNMAFYYQEFPKTLRSLATAMAPMLVALGFFSSTMFMDVVTRVTVWLPENIDHGRLDNVYWTLAAVGTFNFAYFLACDRRYKYHNRAAM